MLINVDLHVRILFEEYDLYTTLPVIHTTLPVIHPYGHAILPLITE